MEGRPGAGLRICEFEVVMAYETLFFNLFVLVVMHLWAAGQTGQSQVGAVLDDVFCSAEAVEGVNVHQGGERAAFFFGATFTTLCHGAATIPYYDAAHQQALDGQAVDDQ